MDPALEGIFDAPSTAQSSGAASSGGATSTNTAEFGIRDGRNFDDGPSAAVQRNRMVAAPATPITPTVERGRSRRPERSNRSISTRITTIHDTTIKSKSKSRPPKMTVSLRGNKELTADEMLDNAIAEAKKKAVRAKTPERTRMAVEDRPQLLASPDPLMQPYEANLEQVVPVQLTMKNTRPAMEISVETDPEMVDDLEDKFNVRHSVCR